MWKIRDIITIAFLIAVGLTPILRSLAFHCGILDHPKSHGIHAYPVPRLGGAALYLAFVAGALSRMDLNLMLKGVLLGSTIVFVIGLIDDIHRLRASLRLAVQLAACAVMMFKYGVILEVSPWLQVNVILTVLGIIGLTNAINFLDNMDGLAAGLVMISSLALTYLAFATHQYWLGYLSSALVGSTAGFLVFNLRKAHVFMGDSGSTFLGFTLASLTVMADWSKHLAITISVPLLILGVPILDMILITILRIKEKKVKNFRQWIDYAGKDHLSHRFMRLGLGRRGAVFAVWGLQALFCLIALMIFFKTPLYGLFGISFYAFVTLGIIAFFRKRRIIFLRFNGRRRKRSTLTARA